MYEFIMRRALNDVATLTPGQMGVLDGQRIRVCVE